MPKEKLKIRNSQIITTYGVGSVIDLDGKSFVGADISRWPIDASTHIYLERLSEKLGVAHFKKPPVQIAFSNNNVSLPYPYFPRWMFCKDSKCRTFYEYTSQNINENDGKLLCIDCGKETLSPIRFVACCKDGHLQEVNWQYYIHKNSTNNCSLKKFKFKSTGKGGGLSANIVSCECGASANLRGILQQPIGKCFGKQPWENSMDYEIKECKNDVKGYLRGGSQLYKPTLVSAIDIPTGETSHSLDQIERVKAACLEGDIKLRAVWGMLKANYSAGNNDIIEQSIDHIIESRIFEDCTPESIKIGIYSALEEVSEETVAHTFDVNVKIDELSIRLPEWKVLTKDIEQKSGQNFWSTPVNFDAFNPRSKPEAIILRLLDKVVLIHRLREVRALKSFTRLGTSPEISVCRPSAEQANHENWLPALQVFGEGIFISFKADKLNEWLSQEAEELSKRLINMNKKWHEEGLSKYNLPEPDPSFVMLHTLSHILIRQLCFQSGYQSASIRERIYYQSGTMQGILIYTADSDAEGALGGLVRQGELETLVPTIRSALQTAYWCSNDPVCINAGGQGLSGLNKGACHSCSLAATTSCENMNALLDRGMLIGDDKNVKGFFSEVIEEIYK